MLVEFDEGPRLLDPKNARQIKVICLPLLKHMNDDLYPLLVDTVVAVVLTDGCLLREVEPIIHRVLN